METTNTVYFHDASSMDELDDESIQLVVTSPPYPMIEMWDQAFSCWNDGIASALEECEFERAFELMHQCLSSVWSECHRVLQEGGIMCINVGDATRSEHGSFRLYHNHAKILDACVEAGFDPMPGILWRKTTNKPTKFMGSGMIAPNAYVTMEHEHILIFRKGDKRSIPKKRRKHRYESAFFWEERNLWFSDMWTGLNGVSQSLEKRSQTLRERSAAFPLELPLRLINMFSVYGDSVLDPFWGTGTTSLAASLLKRHAIGYEFDSTFWEGFLQQLQTINEHSHTYLQKRLTRHREFLATFDGTPSYHNTWYDMPVITRQERSIRFYSIERAMYEDGHTVQYTYRPFEG